MGYIAVILGIFFGELWIKNRIEAKEKSEPAQSGKQNARKLCGSNLFLVRRYHNTGAMLSLGKKRRLLVVTISVIFSALLTAAFLFSLGRRGNVLLRTGLALLLGTRNLGYAQSFCGSFALLHDGVLMARGSLDSLRQGAGARFRAALRLAEGEEGPPGFRWEDGFWQKEIGSEKEMPALIAQLVGQGRGLYEAKMVSPTLEEVYRGYVAGGRRREALADGQQDGQGPEGAAAPGSGAQGQPEGQGPAQPGGEEG